MIESSEQNKKWYKKFKFNLKNNISYQIITVMLFYWFLGNIILLSLINVFFSPWKLISGFNLGFLGALISFCFLLLATKWIFNISSLKQTFAYFIFLFRLLLFAALILLIIYFNFSNLISIIVGFSLLMLATLTNEFLLIIKLKKEQK